MVFKGGPMVFREFIGGPMVLWSHGFLGPCFTLVYTVDLAPQLSFESGISVSLLFLTLRHMLTTFVGT